MSVRIVLLNFKVFYKIICNNNTLRVITIRMYVHANDLQFPAKLNACKDTQKRIL